MNRVLLTVSGEIDQHIEEKIAKGKRPLTDYIAMARRFGADLIDYKTARSKTGRMGRLIEKVAGADVMLAWACYRERKNYRVIFTDGEQVGLPLAFFLKYLNHGVRPRHLMVGHILSVRKKELLLDTFRLQSHVDTFFVYSTWQKHFIEERWSVPEERVVFTPFMVDDHFFAPQQAKLVDENSLNLNGRPVICSVGLEFRDYPTLIEAVRGLDIQLVIAAASPWS